MKKITFVLLLLAVCFNTSAQIRNSAKESRWIVGIDGSYTVFQDKFSEFPYGGDIYAIFGKELNDRLFLGAGLEWNTMKSEMYNHDTEEFCPPYYHFVGILGNFQIDLDKSKSPFYIDLRLGGGQCFCSGDDRGWKKDSPYISASYGIGKRFIVGEKNILSVSIRHDWTVGILFLSAPYSLGVSWDF